MAEFGQYKSITSKLKRRILRKPNFNEAIKNLAQLSNQLQIHKPYSGYCHLAIAKCESLTGDQGGQVGALLDAARAFSQSGRDNSGKNRLINSASSSNGNQETGDDSKAAIWAYQQALLYCDQFMTKPISLELARYYESLKMYQEASEYYRRCMYIRQSVQCLILSKSYELALAKLKSCPANLLTVEDLVTMFLLELLLNDPNRYNFQLPIIKDSSNSTSDAHLYDLNGLLESLLLLFKSHNMPIKCKDAIVDRLSTKLGPIQIHLLYLISTTKK